MGKIRVKAFDESQEEKDRKLEARRETKKGDKKKGTEEKLETQTGETQESTSDKAPAKQGKEKFKKVKVLGKRFQENQTKVNKNTVYPLKDAVELLKSLKTSKFDETVELHINVKEKGTAGQVILPHGTGKKIRIAVASDEVIAQVEKGTIDFDVLVAQPQMMPKLAKVAKILGPRGLMPNPKNGTISQNPDEVIKKMSAGQVNYKTEAAAPIIHLSVGKISFETKALEENVKTILDSVGAQKITSVTLKSTMSPAIKVQTS